MLARYVAEAVADQMHGAGLHDGGRPHLTDNVGQPLKSVADQEERVGDASVAQVGQYGEPELG